MAQPPSWTCISRGNFCPSRDKVHVTQCGVGNKKNILPHFYATRFPAFSPPCESGEWASDDNISTNRIIIYKYYIYIISLLLVPMLLLEMLAHSPPTHRVDTLVKATRSPAFSPPCVSGEWASDDTISTNSIIIYKYYIYIISLLLFPKLLLEILAHSPPTHRGDTFWLRWGGRVSRDAGPATRPPFISHVLQLVLFPYLCVVSELLPW